PAALVFLLLDRGAAGGGLAEPEQRRANPVRPFLERAERWWLDPFPCHVPGPQHAQCGNNQSPAISLGERDRVELEAAPFRVLTAGVERAQQRAPGQGAGDGKVIAGREHGGGDRCLDVPARTEDADVELLLGECLAEEDALQLVLAVVDRDDDVAGQQGGAQALLQLPLAATLRDDRC